MIRSSAAFLLALPVAVAFTAAPVLAQYAPPPPGAYYRERLPPAVGSYDDDEDLPPPPRNLRRGQQGVLPYPDDEPPLPPPGLYGAPDQRSYGYGQQPYQQQPQQPPPMQGAPSRGMNDPNSLRPPAAIGAAPQGSPQSQIAALPPDYQPETGQAKELPPNLKKQLVDYSTREPAGTLIIDTANTYLYLVARWWKGLCATASASGAMGSPGTVPSGSAECRNGRIGIRRRK